MANTLPTADAKPVALLSSADPYKTSNSETFDFDAYLAALAVNPLLGSVEGRRALTRLDPFAFAVIYMTTHITADDGTVSFGDAHLDWVRQARKWAVRSKEPAASRNAYTAPRSMGKSTFFFLLLPMWAAAHGHVKFVAAFADSTSQAQTHLQTFKAEIERNEMLRQDYPELCSPMLRNRGVTSSDNREIYQASNGFVFMAKGIDASNLGMKVGNLRPDLIILDDVEPGEANYSSFQAEKRLGTLLDSILPLSIYATVVLVGTVTMNDSIVHQLVKHGRGIEESAWAITENFKSHYYPPIVIRDDGTERSVWPAKWPLDYLKSIQGTRSFLKNYQNDPLGASGAYWNADTFVHAPLEQITHRIVSVDPAVTSKASSDFTGIAVVSYSNPLKRARVEKAVGIKLGPSEIRTYILNLIEDDPTIGAVLVETNQGGDTWKAILHDLPVPLKTVHQTVKKEVRAAEVLNLYERGYVFHGEGLNQLEAQMASFPKAPNDDLVDAVTSAIAYFSGSKRAVQPGVIGSRRY